MRWNRSWKPGVAGNGAAGGRSGRIAGFFAASLLLVISGVAALAQDDSRLKRVWFDEHQSACMAEMSTGALGEVGAATWFRVAAARAGNALSSFYAIQATIAEARQQNGEAGIVPQDRNGRACRTGVVVVDMLQSAGVPLTRQNLSVIIRLLGAIYGDMAVVQNIEPNNPIVGAALHLTNPEDTQGYLSASFHLRNLVWQDFLDLYNPENKEPMRGLPAARPAPSLAGISIRAGGKQVDGATVLQLWRDRQRLFAAGLWSGASPGFVYFSDDQGTVYVAGTDAMQNFAIVAFDAPEPQARYRDVFDALAAQGHVGDEQNRMAAERMAAAHPAFGIVMAHVTLADAWQYTHFFLDPKRTRPLHELAASVQTALGELE